jgi:hypothetical protein
LPFGESTNLAGRQSNLVRWEFRQRIPSLGEEEIAWQFFGLASFGVFS